MTLELKREPREEELASELNTSIEDIREMIGADSLDYLSMENLLKALGEDKGFCLGCFNGVYPVSTPIETDKNHLER